MKEFLRTHKILLIPLLFILILFVDRVSIQQKNKHLHIIGWENHLLIHTENQTFLWGDMDEKSKLFQSSFHTFGTPLHFPQPPLPIQEGLSKGTYSQTSILFIETENIDLTLPYSLKSDWWVLSKTIIPENLPFPTKGILFVGKQKPGKSLQNKAKELQIPLLTVSQTNSFWLTKKEKNYSLKIEKEK